MQHSAKNSGFAIDAFGQKIIDDGETSDVNGLDVDASGWIST